MSETLTSIIKEITSDVTIERIPAITPQDRVTAEFVNAVNQGFKLGINGNFKLIKAHNGLHIDTLSGKEFSGKSRFVGVFESVNQGTTIPEFEVNFGLVKFVDFNNENFWKDFLQDTILFVKVNNSNNGSILHLKCKFLTQSQTTDGDGDTSITYLEPEETVQLRLIKSDEEPYTVNNLIDKITPIKLSFDEIDSGIISFNAQTTDDITVADLTNLWEEVNTLNGRMTTVENGLDNKVEKKTTAGLHAYAHNGAVETEIEISQLIAPDSIVQRDFGGFILTRTADGTYAMYAANVQYVNDKTAQALTTAKDYTDTKIADLNIGEPNGVCPLESDGKVSANYLPSYVDDVVEVANYAILPTLGESGKIYVTLDTNLQYRWSGSQYVEISKSLALGETSTTAYQGDKGKELRDAFNRTGEDTLSETQITYYVHKAVGDNTRYDYGTRQNPFLTIAEALAAAATKTGTAGQPYRAGVYVLDAGIYTENLTIPNKVLLVAPFATIVGTIAISNNAKVDIYRHIASASNQNMLSKSGTEISTYRATISDGRGLSGDLTGVKNSTNTTSTSILYVSVETMFVSASGAGFQDSASDWGHVHIDVKDCYLATNSYAIRAVGTSSYILGDFDHILPLDGATGTTGVYMDSANGVVSITAEEIKSHIACNVQNGLGLYINCPIITGTYTGTYTGAAHINGNKPFMEDVAESTYIINCNDNVSYIFGTAPPSVAITITNAYNGFKGNIITTAQLTLPANSTYDADFDYVQTDEDNPLYEYEFKCILLGSGMYYKWARKATQAIGPVGV